MHKKIAVISPAEFPGKAGDTANYSEIINQLSSEGFQVLLICPKNSHPNERNLGISSGVKIIRIPYEPPRLKQTSNRLKPRHYLRLLLFLFLESLVVLWVLANKQIRYAIVRHGISTIPLPVICRLLRIRSVADGELVCDSLKDKINPWVLNLLKLYERKIVRFYTYFKVPTHSQFENLRKFGLPKEKILIIPIGINIDRIPKFSVDEIPEHTFGYFGSLERWAGVDILLEAFKLLVMKIPKAKLFIIGDGSLKNNFEEMVIRNNLSANVVFTSVSREELWHTYFRKFRITVNPMPKQINSMDSNLPIKVIESLAAGKPTIAMDIPSSKEIQEGAVFIVPTENSESLAQAMETLSTNKEIMKRYAEMALATSINYDISDKIKKLVTALVDDNS